MNIQQRLSQLEQTMNPTTKDNREPLLIEFIGYDSEPKELAGILYTYGDNPSERRLNEAELAEYLSTEVIA